MKVEEIDIDIRLKNKLIEQNIFSLYPPQEEAIRKGLLESKNLVVAIPTASGKTLIAIFAMFSALINNPGCKVIYLAPLRALASEKYNEIKEYADLFGYKISISTGDLDENSNWLGKSDIIIATNEKFDSLIRHQVKWLNDIKVIVSDEVHLINDSGRGPVLEVVLTLVKRNIPDCQIIALSATIKNADEITKWLNAELIFSNWRPVDLEEMVWSEGEIHLKNGKKRELKKIGKKFDYIDLVHETLKDEGQVLVFNNTRKSAMKASDDIGKSIVKVLDNTDLEKLLEISMALRSSGEKTSIRERLANAVERGVAFHHAGLIAKHRRLIEEGFKKRIIKVISATPTLAAGVNLPGRRVIIRSLYRYSGNFGYNFIPVLEYKQMAGRAGRPRYDKYGESVIVVKDKMEVEEYLDRYIRSDTEEISSKLSTEPSLRSHILSFIASEYVEDYSSALEILSFTFYGFQYGTSGNVLISEGVDKTFELLIDAELISKNEPFSVTRFGRRVSELYLDPLSAKVLKMGLESSNQSTDLPIMVYLQLIAFTPDVRTYNMRQKDLEKLIEIEERYRDHWLLSDYDYGYSEFNRELFFSTIKVSAIIEMWLEEYSEEKINEMYGVTSGDLHHLVERYKWLVYCALEISKIYKWKDHKKVLNKINIRLNYGVKEELIHLVKIRGVGRVRARTLFDNGFKNSKDILNANMNDLAILTGFGSQIAKNIFENARKENRIIGVNDTLAVDDENSVSQTSLSNFFE